MRHLHFIVSVIAIVFASSLANAATVEFPAGHEFYIVEPGVVHHSEKRILLDGIPEKGVPDRRKVTLELPRTFVPSPSQPNWTLQMVGSPPASCTESVCFHPTGGMVWSYEGLQMTLRGICPESAVASESDVGWGALKARF